MFDKFSEFKFLWTTTRFSVMVFLEESVWNFGNGIRVFCKRLSNNSLAKQKNIFSEKIFCTQIRNSILLHLEVWTGMTVPKYVIYFAPRFKSRFLLYPGKRIWWGWLHRSMHYMVTGGQQTPESRFFQVFICRFPGFSRFFRPRFPGFSRLFQVFPGSKKCCLF